MNGIKQKLIFLIFLSPLIISTLLMPKVLASTTLKNSQNQGVSNYQVTQSVTYQVEIDYQLTHAGGLPKGSYYYKVARLNDRYPGNDLTKYTPEYQRSELKQVEIEGDDERTLATEDDFGNTFDKFSADLTVGDTISVYYKYEIQLNEIVFDDDITDDEIGSYDKSSDIFDLYVPGSMKYYETDDSALITFSNSIVTTADNPIEMSEDIYDSVVNRLNYSTDHGIQEKGAKWAYVNEKGDCSEYSDLMITLLRIQDIPARKVTGFLYSNEPQVRPELGDTKTFIKNTTLAGGKVIGTNNFLGHAWMEYYVPNIGWIASDPTYGESIDFFNRIDYLRFTTTVGAGIPAAKGEEIIYEYPYIPFPIYYENSEYEEECEVIITVISKNLTTASEDGGFNFEQLLDTIPSYDIISLVLISSIFSLVIILMTKSKLTKQ